MGQKNIYLPADIEEAIESKAKREKKSVSAVVVELIKNQLQPHQFSDSLWKLVGSIDDSSFVRPDQGSNIHDSKREQFD